MTVADCNLLVFLQMRWNNQDVKIFWKFCSHIKSDAQHLYCFSAALFVYSCYQTPTGKNSLITCKMKLNQFISGIISEIIFAWGWSQWLQNMFSSLRGCSPLEFAAVWYVVCLSTVCERENKEGEMLQFFFSLSICSFYSVHQVQAKWCHYTNTESGSL